MNPVTALLYHHMVIQTFVVHLSLNFSLHNISNQDIILPLVNQSYLPDFIVSFSIESQMAFFYGQKKFNKILEVTQKGYLVILSLCYKTSTYGITIELSFYFFDNWSKEFEIYTF